MRPLRAIYQVDPYLFRDSNGRGWGTLDGITEKLDYLQWLGVSHLWLLPFYCNAGRDGGYDVTDHYRIDPRLGDEAAFQRLVDAADARGIGIIVELVMQHSASAHPWFVAAQRGDPAWRRWYLWSDHVPDDGLQPMFPPNEASAWTWDAEAGAFNRHMFYRHEPDLELAHAPVRDELLRVMTFWMQRGVAGFRVDAVPYMVERARHADPRDDGLWLLEEMRATADAQQPGLPLIGEADVRASRYGDFLCQGRRLSHLLDFHLNNHFFLALARGDASEVARVMAEYGPQAPPHTRRNCASGWLMVIRPSAQPPIQRAVSSVTAAPSSGRGSAGRLYSRAWRTWKPPSWSTRSPPHSRRITSAASRSAFCRSRLAGHGWPVMRSFRASPVPSASQIRPGASCSSVAAACATKAGCWRSIGHVTMPRVNALCTASAPAHTQLWPD